MPTTNTRELWRKVQRLLQLTPDTTADSDWEQLRAHVAQFLQQQTAPAVDPRSGTLERFYADLSLELALPSAADDDSLGKWRQCLRVLETVRPLYDLWDTGRFAADWDALLMAALAFRGNGGESAASHDQNVEMVHQQSQEIIQSLLRANAGILVVRGNGAAVEPYCSHLMRRLFSDTALNSHVHDALETALLQLATADITGAFMTALHECLVPVQSRLKALMLLGRLVQQQPLNLHQLVGTPVLEDVLTCMAVDQCRTALSVATETMVMLLPAIAFAITASLSRYFQLYRRIVSIVLPNSILSPTDDDPATHRWPVLAPEQSHSADAATVPHDSDRLLRAVRAYFSTLYVIFPCNLLKDIRANTEDIHVFTFTQALISQHKFHGDLLKSDDVFEVSAERWKNYDPHQVSAQVIQFCSLDARLDVDRSDQRVIDLKAPPRLRQRARSAAAALASLKAKISRKPPPSHIDMPTTDQLATLLRDSIFLTPVDSPSRPVTPPDIATDQLGINDNQSMTERDSYFLPLQDDDDGRHVGQEDAHKFHAEEMVQAILQTYHSNDAPSATVHANSDKDNEILLLKSEVLFERYLREQALSMLKHSNREQMIMKEIEANRETLYQVFRNQKQELNQIRDLMERQKKELTAIQQKHVSWESELSTKLRTARDECKRLQQVNQERGQQLNTLQAFFEQTRETHAREVDTIQRLQTLLGAAEDDGKELATMREHINQLRENLIVKQAEVGQVVQLRTHQQQLEAELLLKQSLLADHNTQLRQHEIATQQLQLQIRTFQQELEAMRRDLAQHQMINSQLKATIQDQQDRHALKLRTERDENESLRAQVHQLERRIGMLLVELESERNRA